MKVTTVDGQKSCTIQDAPNVFPFFPTLNTFWGIPSGAGFFHLYTVLGSKGHHHQPPPMISWVMKQHYMRPTQILHLFKRRNKNNKSLKILMTPMLCRAFSELPMEYWFVFCSICLWHNTYVEGTRTAYG